MLGTRAVAFSRRGAARFLSVLAVSAGALTACDPRFVPENADRAALILEIGSTGDAEMDVLLGGVHNDELRTVAETVGRHVFPRARVVRVEIDDNDPGRAYAVVHAEDVYIPGPTPDVKFDSRGAVSILREAGFTDVRVTVGVPSVPRNVEFEPHSDFISADAWTWDPSTVDDAPVVGIAMRPEEWRGWLALVPHVLILCAGAIGALVWIRPRPSRWARPTMIGVGVVGLGAFAIIAVFNSSRSIDNLGVSGLAGSTPLAVVGVVFGIGAFIALLISIGVGIVGVVWDRSTQRRLSPRPDLS